MSVLLVTYDLDKELTSKDYQGILKIVKEYPWARLSESSYAIETNSSPKTVFARFDPYLDAGDTLLVITLTKPYWGRAGKDVNDWLKSKLT